MTADHVACAASAAGAVMALPCTLPALLDIPSWQRSPRSVALLLERLAAAMQQLGAIVLDPLQPVDCIKLLRYSLLSVRHALPPDMWPHLAVPM